MAAAFGWGTLWARRTPRTAGTSLVVVDRKIARAGALVDELADERVAGRPQMLFWLAVARYFTGGFEPARAAAERGLRVAQRTGPVRARVRVAPWLGGRGARPPRRGRGRRGEALKSALLSGHLQVAYRSSIVPAGRRWRAAGSTRRSSTAGPRGRRSASSSTRRAGTRSPMPGWPPADPRGALAALEAFGWVAAGAVDARPSQDD